MPGEFKRSCITEWATEKHCELDDCCPHRCNISAMASQSIEESDAEHGGLPRGATSSAPPEPPADIAALIADAEDGTGLL
jgi:hypothetical protein